MEQRTRVWDGCYASHKDAKRMLRYFSNEYPGGQWALVKQKDAKADEAMFHTHPLPRLVIEGMAAVNSASL
jgi:hypothetical protein